jgi:salicylate hydroxylase
MASISREAARVVVVGGGIGGLAAALSLARLGIGVTLLEQSTEIAEIGAGLQLGPNAFAALDALGIGEGVRRRSVFTERLVMMDAIDASEVVSVPVGEEFRRRFGNPYAVSHRADLHRSILESVEKTPSITLHTSTKVTDLVVGEEEVTVTDQDARTYRGSAVVGCDGIKSVIRDKLIGDDVRVSGHVVYRAVVPGGEMPQDLRWNAPVIWCGPNYHLVHYPLRGGDQYNLVVTFRSRKQETWGVTEGSKEEVLSYFVDIHPRPRALLDKPKSWKRWATADRNPVAAWGKGRATLVGDAAHPMLQYMAQGACMALEDAVTLGKAMEVCDRHFEKAFRLYETARVTRTARVVLSTREMGRIYHASGVERSVRNSLWIGRKPQQFYDALEWLYGWTVASCLDGVRREASK